MNGADDSANAGNLVRRPGTAGAAPTGTAPAGTAAAGTAPAGTAAAGTAATGAAPAGKAPTGAASRGTGGRGADGSQRSHRTLAERDLMHFAAVGLLGVAVLIGLAAQGIGLLDERYRLARAFEAQGPAVEEASHLRARVELLARELHKVSEQGYPIGRALVTDLRGRGIAIDVSADPPISRMATQVVLPAVR